MIRMTRWLVVAAAGSTLLAMACGGGDDKPSNNQANGTTQPGASTPAVDNSGALGTVTPAPESTTNCFGGLQRFRYSGTVALKLSGAQGTPSDEAAKASGSYVAPDRLQSKVEAGGQSIEVITIGADVYSREGTGNWTKEDAGGNLNINPADLCQVNAGDLDKAGIKPTQEKVNGQETLKYTLDKSMISKSNALGGPATALTDTFDTLTMTLWVTQKEKWPVRVTIVGSSKDQSRTVNIDFSFTDYNKADIKIDAPKT